MSSSEQGGWANPGPAGLTALAVACFTFYSILTPHLGPDGKAIVGTQAPLLACWLIGGFVVQLVVAIIEFKEGALIGGNVFLVFCAFFMLTGGLEFVIKSYFAAVGPKAVPLDTIIDGWAWLVLLITLILWTPCYLKTAPAALGLTVLILDVGVFFVCFGDLQLLNATMAHHWAALALLLTGIFGMYVAAGIQLNTAFGKTILPLGKPLI
ncbi:MAG TPA: hypothetical protein VN426_08300 [Syntrophomonadaceae bacterium]|nr:hypothetical protein [Syntrophomonadaceae bacterium]